MASTTLGMAGRGILRTSQWDAVMIALSIAHGALLIAIPTLPLIALALWWNANTISHNFVHRPFFHERWVNRLFGAYLSVLLGFPQALWRDRHLAHHAGLRHDMVSRLRLSCEFALQVAFILSLWAAIAALDKAFFFSVYVPGYLAGLGLCALHGYDEHARGTTSHYGALYNILFFNDGFHAEHHANPGMHWTRLRQCREPDACVSAWPAPLRWLDICSLESLERLALRSRLLQRFVLQTHARCLRELVVKLGKVRRVAIVGGGLFPRTALILEQLLPEARITIIDAKRAHLEQARSRLGTTTIEFVNARYTGSEDEEYDLVVIPLAFDGDRGAIYIRPPAPAVLIHDWIWRRRGTGRIVSFVLLKRINLLLR